MYRKLNHLKASPKSQVYITCNTFGLHNIYSMKKYKKWKHNKIHVLQHLNEGAIKLWYFTFIACTALICQFQESVRDLHCFPSRYPSGYPSKVKNKCRRQTESGRTMIITTTEASLKTVSNKLLGRNLRSRFFCYSMTYISVCGVWAGSTLFGLGPVSRAPSGGSVLPCSLKIIPKSPQLPENIVRCSLKLFCSCSQNPWK